MQRACCSRHCLIAIGGGALLDVAGFAAAMAHRGVRLIRVPTTVLSQDDSAIGVKNGINAFDKKNYLGTFAAPFAVINDSRFLPTLSDRDWRSGISEAIKVALIRDAAFFDFIEANAVKLHDRDLPVMEQLVHRSAELHYDHITTNGDPYEQGSSRPLDYGHWAAHKLEPVTDYRLRTAKRSPSASRSTPPTRTQRVSPRSRLAPRCRRCRDWAPIYTPGCRGTWRRGDSATCSPGLIEFRSIWAAS